VTAPTQRSSPRRDVLLEAAYAYVQGNGLTDLSLRPLAAAIGSSPRVLLFLFGSKDELIRAILGRARSDEVALISELQPGTGATLTDVVRRTWQWLGRPEHRPVLILWTEAYSRSLTDPAGPWSDFASGTVRDWLELLAAAQSAARRRTKAGAAERTMALSVLRGGLLDLLATGDLVRVTEAVELAIANLTPPPD